MPPRVCRTSWRWSVGVVAALGVAACGAASAPHGAATAASANGGDPPSAAALARETGGSPAARAAAAANAVTLTPFPGTSDVSPSTQISFLGGAGTAITHVRVTGSSTGAHAGVLRPYSTGTGESFLPAQPFRQGESVTVSAIANGKTVHTSFRIAHQAAIDENEFPTNPGDPAAVQHYRSAPDLTPSTVTITTPAQPGAAPGDLLLAPYQGDGAAGPMITDQLGHLVWFHPLPAGLTATNLQVEQFEGKPDLVWWQGRIVQVGFGQGEDVIYDSSYRRVATIHAGNGYAADLHEIRVEPDGTAWIDIFDPIEKNLSRDGGNPHGIVLDSVVQEIDIKTGLVMWEWHASSHVSPGDSYIPPQKYVYPWDFVHLNSVDPGNSGNVLVSMRNTWALYDIDQHTGGFIWQIGGKHTTFHLGSGVRFYWQHDAEFQPGGLISVLDNGATPAEEKQTRGLVLRPDPAAHTVTLVKAYTNPTKTLLAASQANLLALPGGNWLMGYGGLPNFTEYDGDGHVLLDGTLGKNVQDFRTYLAPWTAIPTTPPSVAAQSSGTRVTVEASWNGATQIAAWQLLAGSSAGSLSPVGAPVTKHGFETTLSAMTAAPQLAVQALDANGHVLSTSAAVSR